MFFLAKKTSVQEKFAWILPKRFPSLLLMVQKSCKQQLRLVVYPIIYMVLYILGGDQQYCKKVLSHHLEQKNQRARRPHPSEQTRSHLLLK